MSFFKKTEFHIKHTSRPHECGESEVCIYIYICIYICIYTCIYIYIYIHVHAPLQISAYAYIHVCTHSCMYTNIHCTTNTVIHMYKSAKVRHATWTVTESERERGNDERKQWRDRGTHKRTQNEKARERERHFWG